MNLLISTDYTNIEPIPILTLGEEGPSIPPYLTALNQGSWYKIRFQIIEEFIFLQNQMIWPYTDIN